jgi:hypothetical protein
MLSVAQPPSDRKAAARRLLCEIGQTLAMAPAVASTTPPLAQMVISFAKFIG